MSDTAIALIAWGIPVALILAVGAVMALRRKHRDDRR